VTSLSLNVARYAAAICEPLQQHLAGSDVDTAAAMAVRADLAPSVLRSLAKHPDWIVQLRLLERADVDEDLISSIAAAATDGRVIQKLETTLTYQQLVLGGQAEGLRYRKFSPTGFDDVFDTLRVWLSEPDTWTLVLAETPLPAMVASSAVRLMSTPMVTQTVEWLINEPKSIHCMAVARSLLVSGWQLDERQRAAVADWQRRDALHVDRMLSGRFQRTEFDPNWVGVWCLEAAGALAPDQLDEATVLRAPARFLTGDLRGWAGSLVSRLVLDAVGDRPQSFELLAHLASSSDGFDDRPSSVSEALELVGQLACVARSAA
jgi:hypothetical protein